MHACNIARVPRGPQPRRCLVRGWFMAACRAETIVPLELYCIYRSMGYRPGCVESTGLIRDFCIRMHMHARYHSDCSFHDTQAFNDGRCMCKHDSFRLAKASLTEAFAAQAFGVALNSREDEIAQGKADAIWLVVCAGGCQP